MYAHAALGDRNGCRKYSGNCRDPSNTTRIAASAVNRYRRPTGVAVRLFPRAKTSQNNSHAPQSAPNA